MKPAKQKIYCYVDETGQDTRSELFIVVAVTSDQKQNPLRQRLEELEIKAKIGKRKWQKAKWSGKQRMRSRKFLEFSLKESIGVIYFKHFTKPVDYFYAIAEAIEKAIAREAKNNYQAVVYIDGINKKIALGIERYLHQRNIKSQQPRNATDESEPFIRLADRFAGCIRGAFEKRKKDQEIISRAQKQKYLREV